MKLMLDNEQVGAAKTQASTLSVKLRNDAKSVLDFATQGVHVPKVPVHIAPFESAEVTSSGAQYGPMWARGRALLVASEKIAQVVQLVKHGKRRSLQEGVQLLVTIEESDLPRLFTVCREIIRLTDAEQQREHGQQGTGQQGHQQQGAAMHSVAAGGAACSFNGGAQSFNRAGAQSFNRAGAQSFNRAGAQSFNRAGAQSFNRAGAQSFNGGSSNGASFQARPRTVWWHLIDDDDDAVYEVRELADWAVARDLRKARLQLMSARKGSDAISTLEKLRSDLLLYARDAC